MFEELEDIGKTTQEDVSDAGMPVHGEMGGDISKCPYYAAKMGMLLYFSCKHCAIVSNIKMRVLFKFVFSFSAPSGVGWNGICLSTRHGRTPTPNRTGSVCYLVCCSGWIGCMVSDVIQPSAFHFAAVREREEKDGGRDSKEILPQDVHHFVVSYTHSLWVQVYLMLHIC